MCKEAGPLGREILDKYLVDRKTKYNQILHPFGYIFNHLSIFYTRSGANYAHHQAINTGPHELWYVLVFCEFLCTSYLHWLPHRWIYFSFSLYLNLLILTPKELGIRWWEP